MSGLSDLVERSHLRLDHRRVRTRIYLETAMVALYDELCAKGASNEDASYIGGYQIKGEGYFLYVTRYVRPDEELIEVVSGRRLRRMGAGGCRSQCGAIKQDCGHPHR